MPDATPRPDADAALDALLHQLRQQTPVQPRPFFCARVQARLTALPQAVGLRLPGWVRLPAYAALLGVLGLALSGDGVAVQLADTTSHYPGVGHPPTLLPR